MGNFHTETEDYARNLAHGAGEFPSGLLQNS